MSKKIKDLTIVDILLYAAVGVILYYAGAVAIEMTSDAGGESSRIAEDSQRSLDQLIERLDAAEEAEAD